MPGSDKIAPSPAPQHSPRSSEEAPASSAAFRAATRSAAPAPADAAARRAETRRSSTSSYGSTALAGSRTHHRAVPGNEGQQERGESSGGRPQRHPHKETKEGTELANLAHRATSTPYSPSPADAGAATEAAGPSMPAPVTQADVEQAIVRTARALTDQLLQEHNDAPRPEDSPLAVLAGEARKILADSDAAKTVRHPDPARDNAIRTAARDEINALVTSSEAVKR